MKNYVIRKSWRICANGRNFSRWNRAILRFWGILIFFGFPLLVWGHDPGLSSAVISLHSDKLAVTLTFARRDAEQIVEYGGGTNFEAGLLAKIASQEFWIRSSGADPIAQGPTTSFDGLNNAVISWDLTCHQCSSLKIDSRLLRYVPRGHRQYVTVRVANGKTIAEFLLSAQDHAVEVMIPAALASEATTSSPVIFLPLGIKHILTGYDHLMFLFGLLLVTRRFTSALRIITCFTIAHSITLAVATLSPVPAPPRLVEPLIAASIVYVGFENLARGGEPKGRSVLTFLFGLIHGCGFASALREFGIGTNGSEIALPLICFNGGVELGQLMIAAILLPVIWKLQTRPAFVRRFVPASSAAVVLLGAYWFVQRVWMS